VKQTRNIQISDRVFTAEDIRRLANIIEAQKGPSKKAGHHVIFQYAVRFDDTTSLESDSPEVFDDEPLTSPARPVGIQMAFYNHSLGRQISIDLTHSDDSYRNTAQVSGNDAAWVSHHFLSIKEAIEKAAPQVSWLRNHATLLLNLIALGLGCFGSLMLDGVYWLFLKDVAIPIKPLPLDSPWRQLVNLRFWHVLGWMWLWGWGFFLGAFTLRDWLLRLWPQVEFNFGLAHLQIERLRRQRIALVGTIIVIPILLEAIYDIIKARF
jgi:hypothetical protein